MERKIGIIEQKYGLWLFEHILFQAISSWPGLICSSKSIGGGVV